MEWGTNGMPSSSSVQPVPIDVPAPASAFGHIGMIAGEGDFPFMVARAARDRGIQVTAIGINGITDPKLADEVDAMHWVEFGKMNRLIETCHRSGFTRAVMVGRIHHNNIFKLAKMDWRGIKMLAKAPTRRANDLLGAVMAELAHENIELLDSTLLLRECMPGAGVLTPDCLPSEQVMDDIEFGRPLARAIAGLDVGQTVVVKHRAIVAVEAMEGTDQTILRAGEIAGPGCVVIKIDKPRQDRRFDVPVVGLATVQNMIRAECAALAFPGGQTLFFEQEASCRLAADRGIAIYAWQAAGGPSRPNG
jgi:DUF1009 family protein